MKRIPVLILFCLLTRVIFSQQWSASLSMAYYPPADLYIWENDPNIVTLSVTNTGFSSRDVNIYFAVSKQENGEILKANSKIISFMPGETQVFMSLDFLDWGSVQYSSAIKNTVVQTGQLPEGTYTMCARVKDDQEQLAEVCQDFQIMVADPPYLLSPEHLSVLETKLPFFQWTPCNVLSPLTVDYKFTLVELLPGQALQKALNSNPPVYETIINNMAFLQYPPDALELEPGKNYAWQVQGITGSNSSATVVFKNNGFSEQYSFKIPEEEIEEPHALELVSPLNNSIMTPSQITQWSKGYKFEWSTTSFTKTISSYILKISEILPGQTSEAALNNNPPVYYRDDILPAYQSEFISDGAGILINQKKYAWRVWINSPNWGGVIDSSDVWSFTAQNTMELVKLISPANFDTLEADTLHSKSNSRTYQFTWDKKNVTKTISYFTLKIAEVHPGQTAAQALAANIAVLSKDNLSAAYVNYTLDESLGLLKDNQKYAWQVKAYSSAWGGFIAVSEAWEFTVKNGITQISSLSSFVLGGYNVTVKSITNKNSQSFGGKGEITLWNQGPLIQFDFDKLKLTPVTGPDNKTIWKVTEGEVWKPIVTSDIPLTTIMKGQAVFRVKALRMQTDKTFLNGSVLIKSTLLTKEFGSLANIKIESIETWVGVDPLKKITSLQNYQLSPKQNYSYPLLTPLNFDLNISSLKSTLQLNSNVLTVKLWGELFLPQSVKDMQGNRVSIKFFEAPDFLFDIKINELTHLRLVKNSDIRCILKEASVNLYSFGVLAKSAEIAFDHSKTNILNIVVTSQENFKITSTGLNFNFIKTDLKSIGTFRGYRFKPASFGLHYENNILKNTKNALNFLKGKVIIPFLGTQADINFNITQDGLSTGIVSTDNLTDWITIYGGQSTDELNLQMKIVGGLYYLPYQNIFCMNGYFRYTSPTTNKGITTDNLPVSNFSIDSTGLISIMGAVDGWINLSVNKSGKYNGFPITLDRFKVINNGINYSFGVSGTIVLADNLSSQNGSPFLSTLNFSGNQDFGKSGAEPPSGQVSTQPIPVDFGNGESDFGASLTWFDNDPVYGKGFMAATNLTMHDPCDFSVFSKLIIGKTNNGAGFSYWFVEAGAEFPFAISTGVGDLGIKGFTGRVFSHMKHSGENVLASDYIPDAQNVFGVYAMVPFMSMSDDGAKLWGKTALEITVGKGFKSVLYGEVDVLCAGYKEEGRIKGNATITVSTSPPLFDATVNVSADLWGGLCGNGTMQMHISETEWFLNVGTAQQPITVNMFCASTGSTGYFQINKNYITMGAGYGFNTGPQKWGKGLGCYGKAAGNISMTGTIYYKPLNFAASASLSASGEIGVFIDIEVYTGYLSLLSGEMSAALQVQFPDPACFAGEVYARACIKACAVSCKVCASARFRIRYKNGSFALKNSCET